MCLLMSIYGYASTLFSFKKVYLFIKDASMKDNDLLSTNVFIHNKMWV